MHANPYAMTRFDTTENIVTRTVMTSVFRKNVKNGIACTAWAKLPQSSQCGNHVAGKAPSSALPLSAEMTIQ